jgi:hypothetical protein
MSLASPRRHGETSDVPEWGLAWIARHTPCNLLSLGDLGKSLFGTAVIRALRIRYIERDMTCLLAIRLKVIRLIMCVCGIEMSFLLPYTSTEDEQ